LEADKWLEGEVIVACGKGSSYQVGSSSYPYIQDECIPASYNFMSRNKLFVWEILVGA
jgi:hypothetical protein